MAVLPFGMWDVGESFHQAIELEDEEDDQYEEEAEDKVNKFEIQCLDNKSLKSESLIIAIGTAATTFIEMFVDLPTTHAGEVICSSNENLECKKHIKQSCRLSKIGNKIICLCKSYVRPEDGYSWIKQLLSFIQPKQVAVLASQPRSSFLGDGDVKESDSDILRHLKTSETILTSSSLLESGIIIKDIPAAVLSHCRVFEIPAILYMNFTESQFVDVFSLKAYQPILMDKMLEGIPLIPQSVLSEKLKSFEGIGFADNVYI